MIVTIKLNPNNELVNIIRNKLQENQELYGQRYCPCVPSYKYQEENSDDYICMCKDFHDLEEGECHCGLYIKTTKGE